jgi:hypothetical protein
LAVRLYLGGSAAPRRYFAWGQAVRRAVLALTLLQAVRGLGVLLLTAWSRRVFSWLPVPPAKLAAGTPAGIVPPMVWWLVAYAWIVSEAGAYRVLSLTDYLHDPHRVQVSLAELLILVLAVALIVPDATRAQAATPATASALGIPG